MKKAVFVTLLALLSTFSVSSVENPDVEPNDYNPGCFSLVKRKIGTGIYNAIDILDTMAYQWTGMEAFEKDNGIADETKRNMGLADSLVNFKNGSIETAKTLPKAIVAFCEYCRDHNANI